MSCATNKQGLAGGRLSGDSARERVSDVLVGLRDQLADIAAVRKKQAALEVAARSAEGSVEVTVNARGQLVRTVIDQCFLDDHDFDELGGYITEAAQAAAAEAAGRVAELVAPINERHKRFPSFSDIVAGLPDPSDVMPPGLEVFTAGTAPQKGSSVLSVGGSYDDGNDGTEFPTVRR
jgi:DNA-binding protein YbaB